MPEPKELQVFCLQPGKLAIGSLLQFAINKSVMQKYFSFFLETNITVFKNSKMQVSSHFLPICITNTLSKVFERLLLKQFMEYLKPSS